MPARRHIAGLLVLGMAAGWPASALAAQPPVKAAVVRSTGTLYLGQTIWSDLNSGWSNFGDVPVQIDYTSLAGNITSQKLQATGADVLILSNPAFFTYTQAEVNAIKEYVEAGHGLIISYGKFRSEDLRLAPLVGLSESISLGTGTATDPFWIEPATANHPLFDKVSEPYISGVREVTTQWGAPPWPSVDGVAVSELLNEIISRRPGFVTHETPAYRGLYFSYYIENRSGGSNQQDMQVFYNGLLWTAGIPEPSTLFLVMPLLLVRRRLSLLTR